MLHIFSTSLKGRLREKKVEIRTCLDDIKPFLFLPVWLSYNKVQQGYNKCAALLKSFKLCLVLPAYLSELFWQYRSLYYRTGTDQRGTGTEYYRYSNGQRFCIYWFIRGNKQIYLQDR